MRGTWAQIEDRGRVVAEEARCRDGAGGRPTLRWLTSATRWLAEVAAPWEELTGEVPDGRRYRLVVASPHLESWVITWPAGGRLDLHDHGGAAGCLEVVEGSLVERRAVAGPVGTDGTRPLSGPVRTRGLSRGRRSAFGPDDVHDVANPSAAPATSVHVYSSPSRVMGFWAVDGARLRPVAPRPDDTGTTSTSAALHGPPGAARQPA